MGAMEVVRKVAADFIAATQVKTNSVTNITYKLLIEDALAILKLFLNCFLQSKHGVPITEGMITKVSNLHLNMH